MEQPNTTPERKDDGGPAFPQHMTFNCNGDPVTPGMYFEEGSGMTLRDWFAGQALAASDWSNWDTGKMYESRIVERCYQLADAMLAERRK